MIRGYVRVSTVEQRIDRQLKEIESISDVIYVDKVSGKNIDNRVELRRMMDDIRSGDEIVILSIDRLSRSTIDLLQIVNDITTKGAKLRSLQDSWLDTTNDNPLSDFLLTVMGALAEMERKQINKRVKEGIEIAKEKGVKFGRPKVNDFKIRHAIELYNKGNHTVKEIEKITDVSKATLYRRLKEG